MKRNTKLFTSMFVVLLILSAGLFTGFSFNPIDSVLEEYSQMTETNMMNTLSKKSFTEILNEINALSRNNAGLSDMIFHASSLAKRVNAISEKEIVSEIFDDTNSIELRVVLIQLSKYKNNRQGLKDETKLKSLLLNEETDTLLRKNIVWALSDSNEFFEALIFIAKSKDDLLAFQAIKRLNNSSPEIARRIANQILNERNLDSKNDERLRISIKVRAEEFRKKGGDRQEKDAFIAFCTGLFENTHDQIMQDTVVFALSSMKDKNALEKIISNNKIDFALKIFSVDQNHATISEVLEDNPTFEDIEVAIKAMNIYPIEGIVPTLRQLIEDNSRKQRFTELKVGDLNPVNKRWSEY